jgi:hypothetical protein
MRVPQTKGVIDPASHCYLRRLVGDLKNADTLV